jgi:hypothetical protein
MIRLIQFEPLMELEYVCSSTTGKWSLATTINCCPLKHKGGAPQALSILILLYTEVLGISREGGHLFNKTYISKAY